MMDKNRGERRSFDPPKKKQQQQLINSGPIAEESRRDKKLRRLSTVADMGSDAPSGGEQEELGSCPASPRKFKLPRKVFGDSNTVDPASVPRKLRSAIRKRSCDSASVPLPDSKRLNSLLSGVEPLRKDSLSKSKISTQNGCLDHSAKQAASVPISKDEEEVAETLFALAGMIPLSDLHLKNKMDDQSSEAKASDLADKPEHNMPVSTVPKEEQEVTCHPTSGELAITTAMATSSPSNLVQEKSLVEPARLSWPNLSERRPISLNIKVSASPLGLQNIPPLLRTCDQRPLINSTFFHTSTQPSAVSGLNEVKREKAVIPNNEAFSRTRVADVENQHPTLVERRQNGMMSRALHDSEGYGLHLGSSAVIFPSWLNTATPSSRPGTCEGAVSTGKPSSSMNGRRASWKRCASHVYISRLIQVLQISEAKETQHLDISQLRSTEGLAGSLTSERSNSVRNEMNRMLTNANVFSFSDCKDSHEGADIMPVNRRHHQDQQEGPSFSGCCGSKKQSFDFLSLSSGATPAADDHGVNKPESNQGSGTKGHALYQHSVRQQHARSMSFSLPQNHFRSNPYPNQVAPISARFPSTAPQGPQYFGNPFAPGHMFNLTTSAQQPQPKQQQQQQQICGPQLGAQFRPGPLLSSHIMNWQNARKEMWSSTHTGALSPSSQSQPSPEKIQAKFLHISQQQPQMIALGQSLGPPKANHQHAQLLSIHEDSGSQFRPNGALPLQLTLQ